MKDIFRIYFRDLSRLRKNVMALIVIIGVSILPALYAWFNIAANWDPYGNTAGIQVAVSNEDLGYQLSSMKMNVGLEIINNLKVNQQIGWQFTDTKSAVDGVKSGKYYAAVIIPENFSEKISSILSADIESPKIQYYINEKKNAIAPKITDKGVGVIQQQVNSTFIEVATKTIAGVLNVTTEELEENGDTIVGHLVRVLENVDSDLEQYHSAIQAFSDTVDGVDALISTTRLTLPDVSGTITAGKTALRDADTVMDDSRAVSGQFEQSLGDVIDSSRDIFESVSETANQTLDDIGSDINSAAGDLTSMSSICQTVMNMNQKNINALTALNTRLPVPVDEIDVLIEKLGLVNDRQLEMMEKINNSSSSVQSAVQKAGDTRASLNGVLTESKDKISGIRAGYLNTLKPQLAGLLDDLSRSGSEMSGLLAQTDSGLGNLDQILKGMGTALGSGKGALQNTEDLISETHKKIEETVKQLNSAGKDEKLEKLIEIIKNDPDIMGSFMSAPVQLETTSFYPIRNYGSAMAPFYTTLAIWVGGIVLVAILKVRVREDEKLNRLKPYQCYLGRYLLFLSLGLIQALIICLGDLYFLEIQCQNPALFILAGVVSSLVFTNIIYTLTVSFGDIGKAFCVILLVIQIAGSGGTFPIEVTPAFFQNVYPYLPFTYGINAMRETVAGIYGMNYRMDLMRLMLFVPFALILGLFLRKPLIRLNEFFEKRIEDTQLM